MSEEIDEKLNKATLLFSKLDNFGKGLTARQIGLKPPASTEQIRGAFENWYLLGGNLDASIDDMEVEIKDYFIN